MVDVDPLSIHGVVRDSPYAKLYVNVYHLTKPKSPDDLIKEEKATMNKTDEVISNYENISDPEDTIEDGEISESDHDHPPVTPKYRAKSPPASTLPSVANKDESNLFKVPPPPSELKVFNKKQKLTSASADKVTKNDDGLKINQFPSLKRMKSILVRRRSGDTENDVKNKCDKLLLSPSEIEPVKKKRKEKSSKYSSNLPSEFDLDNNQGFAVSGVGGKELKMKTSNKFLTDLQSQFDLDRSPARLEWLQCYLSK